LLDMDLKCVCWKLPSVVGLPYSRDEQPCGICQRTNELKHSTTILVT
jgi:hypothetical protein